MKHILLAMTLGIGLSANTLVAQVALEDVAPERTVLLGGVRDMDRMLERVQRTRLWDLWMHEDLARLRNQLTEAMEDGGFDEMLRDLDIDPQLLARPSGGLGVAVFPVDDPELGMAMPGFLSIADFGDNAEDIAEVIEAALNRAERELGLMYEIRDVSGRNMYVIDFSTLRDDEEDVRNDHHMHMQRPDFSERMEVMHLARDGGVFLLSNDMMSLTDAIDRIDGRLNDRVADRNDYRAVVDQIGENDAYAILLTRDAMSLGNAFDPTGMMLMMARPILRSIFGEIHGIGSGVRFDGDRAMLEWRSSVYTPAGKGGLMKLLDLESPRGDLPAFVGPNATGYTSINFAFDQVTSVLRGVIRSNPMLAMEMGQEYDQMEPMIEQYMSLLGPRIHMLNTVTRPITVDSVHSIVAVECNDVEKFENLISEHAPMIGAEPRDFLGHRIYTLDDIPMMGPGAAGASISLGMGGGYLVYGPTEAVEQAIRAISQPDDAPSLRGEPAYRRAAALLSDRPLVNWGYTNIVDSIEAQVAVFRETMSQAFGEFDMEMMDPEVAAELAEGDEWLDILDGIDFEMLHRFIGPSISQTFSTDEAFILELYVLEGEGE